MSQRKLTFLNQNVLPVGPSQKGLYYIIVDPAGSFTSVASKVVHFVCHIRFQDNTIRIALPCTISSSANACIGQVAYPQFLRI